ncbi:unnamed protein product [Prorocentrum cordatum]|uniref:Uncharacterized protein n=1 Tax=Prorocentrum cordatum TaxID=2364126 RepID=A0ABN9Q8P7_9DINO|nr:unnamed protein product [Polarella glacialis]
MDSVVGEEARARERLARPCLTEQVAAGRVGVLPRPSGGREVCRDWARRAEFGIGAEQVPTTAREAGCRARGPMRRAKAFDEEEGQGEVVLDPAPPFPSMLGPLGGALGEGPAMPTAAANAESADRADGALEERGALAVELRETCARLEAAAGVAAEASAALAEAEGRAQVRAEERDRLALALAEAEGRLQDVAEERDRLALALEGVMGARPGPHGGARRAGRGALQDPRPARSQRSPADGGAGRGRGRGLNVGGRRRHGPRRRRRLDCFRRGRCAERGGPRPPLRGGAGAGGGAGRP